MISDKISILDFEQALIQKNEISRNAHLLMGNGFSIAWNPTIFTYKKLFDKIDFTKLHPKIKEIFDYFKTYDFEFVIRILNDSHLINNIFGEKSLAAILKSEADNLKNQLVLAITENHPELPYEIKDEEYLNCLRFLKNFDHYYTTNYDLLLYWTYMHSEGLKEEKITFNDGFMWKDVSSPYVIWNLNDSYEQNAYYLHGALHLFDGGDEFKKYTWSNTKIPLMTQIKESLDHNEFPVFVSEGTSKEKLNKILHNTYLGKGYKSLAAITGSLFIYGLSFKENDEHIIDTIIANRKLKALFVSIYGSPNNPNNKLIIEKCSQIKEIKRKKEFEIYFFDAESAKIWR